MINGTTVQERIDQFDIKHGDDCVRMSDDSSWLVFADGATREMHLGGIMCEPPDNLAERWDYICTYWKVKYERAAYELHDVIAGGKAQAITAGKNGWAFNDTPILEKLERLRPIAVEAQKQYKAAREEFEKHSPHHRQAALRSMMMEDANKQVSVFNSYKL